MMLKYRLIMLMCFAFAIACKGPESTDEFGKKEMFINYADNIILPAYTSYGTTLNNLQTAFTTFSTNTDATNLSALQTAFLNAYAAWHTCEIYEKTPPAENAMAIDNNNYFPTRKDSIEAYIGRNSTSLSFVQSRIKSDKGLPAMEYLLFSRTLTPTQILERFTIHPNAVAYKAYLGSLISNCINVQASIVTEWTTYRDTYINSLGTDAAGSISYMVNSFAQRVDDFKRHQIGIPAGYQGNVATININPQAAQAYNANKSIEYMLLTLNNLKDVLNGKGAVDGKGLNDYIRTLNVTSTFGGNLADDILAQIDVCIDKVNACGVDYANTITTDKPKADALFLEAKKLLVLMKVDVPSALGVSITYTDSDGD